jgi:hypothetical protein
MTKALVNALLVILFIVAAGCATLGSAGHKYIMKGQILEVADSGAYLCIGSAEGAKVGQEYAVYRNIKMQHSGFKQQTIYRRKLIGAVKITEIVDEHYAKAIVLKGDVGINDVAELNP